MGNLKQRLRNTSQLNNFLHLGFTLAEVLITLGIIGIVAAMTMPSLIASQKEKETVSRLKKGYSTLSQALIFAVNEHGTPDNWEIGDFANSKGAKNIINKLSPYLNVSEDCGKSVNCLKIKDYKLLNGTVYGSDMEKSFSEIKLADGTFIMALAGSNDCTTITGTSEELKNSCAFLYIDTNGNRKPNQVGKDFFEFMLTKNAIIPSGSQFASRETFYSHCLNNSNSGLACTAWVLHNENMDYLHCQDLVWDVKTKCK